MNDTCQAGVCQAGAGADTDNDGYCDAEEIACGCNPNDGTEICSQPNRLVGLAGNGAGEVLLNWYTPTVRKVTMATDPSCATSGAGLCVGQKCVAGRILDRCTTDADCYLPVDTCRVVVNYGDTADAKLVYARFRKTDVPGFVIGTASPATPIPVAPGCSKKVNVLVPTPRRDNLKLKATGTIDAKPRKDVDIIQYRR